MVEVNVNPGACGLKTEILAVSEEAMKASVGIASQCVDIMKIGEQLGTLDARTEVHSRFGDSSVYRLARQHCRHATCPVPAAILKAIEAASGFALPADVAIQMAKAEEG